MPKLMLTDERWEILYHYIQSNVKFGENLTTGNVHDTQPVHELASCLTDTLFCDKGYLSKALEANLLDKGVKLITTVRKNMKAKAISLWDRAMLSKRFIIGTINVYPSLNIRDIGV